MLPWLSDGRLDLQQRSPDPGLYRADRHAPRFSKFLTAFAVNIGSDNQVAPRRIKRLTRRQRYVLLVYRRLLVLKGLDRFKRVRIVTGNCINALSSE